MSVIDGIKLRKAQKEEIELLREVLVEKNHGDRDKRLKEDFGDNVEAMLVDFKAKVMTALGHTPESMAAYIQRNAQTPEVTQAEQWAKETAMQHANSWWVGFNKVVDKNKGVVADYNSNKQGWVRAKRERFTHLASKEKAFSMSHAFWIDQLLPASDDEEPGINGEQAVLLLNWLITDRQRQETLFLESNWLKTLKLGEDAGHRYRVLYGDAIADLNAPLFRIQSELETLNSLMFDEVVDSGKLISGGGPHKKVKPSALFKSAEVAVGGGYVVQAVDGWVDISEVADTISNILGQLSNAHTAFVGLDNRVGGLEAAKSNHSAKAQGFSYLKKMTCYNCDGPHPYYKCPQPPNMSKLSPTMAAKMTRMQHTQQQGNQHNSQGYQNHQGNYNNNNYSNNNNGYFNNNNNYPNQNLSGGGEQPATVTKAYSNASNSVSHSADSASIFHSQIRANVSNTISTQRVVGGDFFRCIDSDEIDAVFRSLRLNSVSSNFSIVLRDSMAEAEQIIIDHMGSPLLIPFNSSYHWIAVLIKNDVMFVADSAPSKATERDLSLLHELIQRVLKKRVPRENIPVPRQPHNTTARFTLLTAKLRGVSITITFSTS